MNIRMRIANEIGELTLKCHEVNASLADATAAVESSYSLMSEIIRSDQMSHAEVVALFQSDPGFAAWYRSQACDHNTKR